MSGRTTAPSEEERASRLRELAATLRSAEDVVDAFVAKSFTDRHVVVDLDGEGVPAHVKQRLTSHDLHRAREVYGDGRGEQFFASDIGDAVRYHFVDIQTCGEHQSYVVE